MCNKLKQPRLTQIVLFLKRPFYVCYKYIWNVFSLFRPRKIKFKTKTKPKLKPKKLAFIPKRQVGGEAQDQRAESDLNDIFQESTKKRMTPRWVNSPAHPESRNLKCSLLDSVRQSNKINQQLTLSDWAKKKKKGKALFEERSYSSPPINPNWTLRVVRKNPAGCGSQQRQHLPTCLAAHFSF